MENSQQPQLIEKTAKKWKACQALGLSIFAVFFVIALYLPNALSLGLAHVLVGGFCLAGMGAGLFIFSCGCIAAWWHHG